jgi:cytochrome b subunit of formate dehydrogenase
VRRALPWILTGLGAALLVTGVALFWLANLQPAGWTAYSASSAPLAAYRSSLTVSFDGGSVLWTGRHLLAAGLAVLGLLVLAAVGGWLLGRRAGRKALLTAG